jgi:hypothetical protein
VQGGFLRDTANITSRYETGFCSRQIRHGHIHVPKRFAQKSNAAIGTRSRPKMLIEAKQFGRRERLKSKADLVARAGAVQRRTRAPRDQIQRGHSAAQQRIP